MRDVAEAPAKPDPPRCTGCGEPHDPSAAATITDRGDGLIAETVDGANKEFIAESRTLLPALADLAESEGRRADEAEAKLANERGAKLFMRGYDQAREDLMRSLGYPWIDIATCGNITETIRGLNITERLQMMMTELAALKGQQP